MKPPALSQSAWRRAVVTGWLSGQAIEVADVWCVFGLPPTDTIPGIEYGPAQIHRWAFLKDPHTFLAHLAERYSTPAPPTYRGITHGEMNRPAVIAWLTEFVLEQALAREALAAMAKGDDDG